MAGDFDAQMKLARDAFGFTDDEALTKDQQERADNLRHLVTIGAAAAFGAFAIAVLASIAPLTVMGITFTATFGLSAALKFCDFDKLVR